MEDVDSFPLLYENDKATGSVEILAKFADDREPWTDAKRSYTSWYNAVRGGHGAGALFRATKTNADFLGRHGACQFFAATVRGENRILAVCPAQDGGPVSIHLLDRKQCGGGALDRMSWTELRTICRAGSVPALSFEDYVRRHRKRGSGRPAARASAVADPEKPKGTTPAGRIDMKNDDQTRDGSSSSPFALPSVSSGDARVFDQESPVKKPYKLLGPDGKIHPSQEKGALGGYRHTDRGRWKYGRLDCPAALDALKKGGYKTYRVFFRNEEDAIAAGFRPCGTCMRERHAVWKKGGAPGTPEYPWLMLPDK